MAALRVSLHPAHRNKVFARTGTVIGGTPQQPERLDDGYDTTEVSAERLVQHIQQGGAWVACTLDSHPRGSGGWRHSDAAGPSNLIVLDIDGDFSLDEFWTHPFNQRHCLFTYTTCSHRVVDEKHPEPQDRFRAVFPCEELTPELHPFVYRELLERLNFSLKDSSGEKPERLWYGNDAAEFLHGEGERLPYELIEDAKDAMARPAAPRPTGGFDDDYSIDCKRICYLLLHLLPVSVDNEYEPYWQPMMAAAIAANSDEVWDAFLDWHKRGHHIKRNSVRRCERERSKGSRSHMGRIMKFAKERLGSDWWKLLPQELQYGGNSSAGPVVLYKTTLLPGGFIKPRNSNPSTSAPDIVPSLTQLSLMQRRAAKRDSAPPCDADEQDTTTEDKALFDDLLDRLYLLRTEFRYDDGEEQISVSEVEAEKIEAILRSQLYAHPIFNREPWRIDRILFHKFLANHGVSERSKRNFEIKKLFDYDSDDHTYVIPSLIASGRSYLLYGRQGTGKTTMALMLARAALGYPGHTTFLSLPPVPMERWNNARVLYVATDGMVDAATDLQNYARQHHMEDEDWIDKHFEVLSMSPRNKAQAWRMDLYDMHFLYVRLQEARDEGRPYTLIIFDSLKTICPPGIFVRDPVVLEYVNALQDICRLHGAANVIIHHQSKDSDTAQGVTGLAEQVAGVFRLKKSDDGGHVFVVEKTRAGVLTQYEFPYAIHDGKLICSAPDQPSTVDDLKPSEVRAKVILSILQAHFDQWRQDNPVASIESAAVLYKGVDRNYIVDAINNSTNRRHFPKLDRSTINRVLQPLTEGDASIEKLGTTRYTTYRIKFTDGADDQSNDYSIPGF